MDPRAKVDPNVGFRSFEALEQLAADHAWAVDPELCAIAQEGWTNVPETDRNVVAARAIRADIALPRSGANGHAFANAAGGVAVESWRRSALGDRG